MLLSGGFDLLTYVYAEHVKLLEFIHSLACLVLDKQIPHTNPGRNRIILRVTAVVDLGSTMCYVLGVVDLHGFDR